MARVDPRATAAARARYDRLARCYDLMERLGGTGQSEWLQTMWQRVRGPGVLEVGVGTGRGMDCYPPGASVTAIGLSPRMMARARLRKQRSHVSVELREADVQALPFADASFDTVIGSCVFCSVPDPVQGLRELRRVLVPGGQLLLQEHVLSQRPVLRGLMRLVNPVVRRMGPNIDRDTVGNVVRAGFVDLKVEELWLDVMMRIEATAPGEPAAAASGLEPAVSPAAIGVPAQARECGGHPGKAGGR